MKKKQFLSALLAVILCLSLVACGQATPLPPGTSGASAVSEQEAPAAGTSTVQSAPEVANASRTITDLGGNQVEIPAASAIQRIVVISPPVMSFVVETIPDTQMIVGINARAFTTSNPAIVGKVFPNWQAADTTFIDAGFVVNTESLLRLDPDIIFYYGNVQKQGLGNVGIPSIDFFAKGLQGPEAISIAWDNQLREIFGLDSSNSQQAQWQQTNEKVTKLLQNTEEETSALCIFSNAAGSIVVSGTDSFDAYAQSFFDQTGIRNVAADLDGTTEVSMEQIYQWNPDMIIVFHDAPAKDMLENSIAGQDWSLLDAWKNKRIYDVPRTTYSWITPCADSPLLPLWLVSKAYPQRLGENEMWAEIVDYYTRNYEISLTDSDLDSILGNREASGS